MSDTNDVNDMTNDVSNEMRHGIGSDVRAMSGTRGGFSPAMTLAALGAEMAKSFRLAWADRKATAIKMPVFIAFYFLINLYIGRGALHRELLAPTLIGYLGFMFFALQVTRGFWGVIEEIQTGTIEQLALSPVPTVLLVLARQAATVIESLLLASLVYASAAAFAGVTLPPNPAALVPLAAFVAGSAGYSLVMSGLTLLYKRLEMLVELLAGAALVFSGAFFPLDRLPAMASP